MPLIYRSYGICSISCLFYNGPFSIANWIRDARECEHPAATALALPAEARGVMLDIISLYFMRWCVNPYHFLNQSHYEGCSQFQKHLLLGIVYGSESHIIHIAACQQRRPSCRKLLGGSSHLVITPVISGLTPLIPFITRVVTHLLSGVSHQVETNPHGLIPSHGPLKSSSLPWIHFFVTGHDVKSTSVAFNPAFWVFQSTNWGLVINPFYFFFSFGPRFQRISTNAAKTIS